MLGRHVGHDSCCCSAVSQPANGLSKLVSAMGRCGRSFVFLGRKYTTLEIRGAVLGRHVGHDSCCCSAVLQPARKAVDMFTRLHHFTYHCVVGQAFRTVLKKSCK